MRTEKVNSDLIAKLGYEGTTMRVVYADGAAFDYFKAPFSTFKALVRAGSSKTKSAGHEWLNLRDQYKFKKRV